MSDTSTPRRGVLRWFAAVAILLGATLVVAAPIEAQAATTDCHYGTGGPSAETFCWFDMVGYSEAEATSDAGQAYSVSLGGGYTASFTLRKTNISGQHAANVVAEEAPLEPLAPRFAFGTAGYAGVDGSPILYSVTTPARVPRG